MNTMKKTLVLVLALVAVIGLMTVCASADEIQHELVYVPAAPACHTEGNVEYWYCTAENCCEGGIYLDEAGTQISNYKSVRIPAVNELTHVEAVPATCETEGCAEYWTCEACEGVFADAAGKQLTNVKNLVILPHSDLIHVEAVAPTCHSNGNVEHWYCEECGYHEVEGGIPSNALSVILPATGEAKLTKVEAKEATCHEVGNNEYYVCECGVCFTDAEGKNETTAKAQQIPATDLVYVEEIPAGCENGVAEHYYCNNCEVEFTYDDNGNLVNTNLKNLTIEGTGHNFVKVEATAPTCHFTGNNEYYTCANCGFCATDAEGKNETSAKAQQIPATALTYVEEVPATCTENGVAEHYYCADCKVEFVYEDGKLMNTNLKNLTIEAAGHNFVKVEATEATCHFTGNNEYYTCTGCGFCSTDAEGKYETSAKAQQIPATALTYVEEVPATCTENGVAEHYYCSECKVEFVYEDGKLMNTNLKNLTIEASHKLVKVEATEATCCRPGNNEYYCCELCGLCSTDAEGKFITTHKSQQIAATDLVYVEEVPATATKNGMMEHYYCAKCDVYYIQNDEGNLIPIASKSLTIPALGETDIPQTGLVWWPVAALSLAGAGMIAAGAVKTKKERDEE